MNLHASASESMPAAGPSPLTLKILAFVAAMALGFAGILNAAMAMTAWVGGDLVSAVGQGAERAAATTDTPEAIVTDDDLHDVAREAKSFALRAKLIAVAIAIVAGAQLLGAELVRRRYKTKAIPIALGVAIGGQIGLAILFGPSVLTAIGVVTSAFGIVLWRVFPAMVARRGRESWGTLHDGT
jgi:hypothetical protein